MRLFKEAGRFIALQDARKCADVKCTERKRNREIRTVTVIRGLKALLLHVLTYGEGFTAEQ
jgi:hypothetical protein